MREIGVVTSSLSISDNVWSVYIEITTLISLITHQGMNPMVQAVVSQAKCLRVYTIGWKELVMRYI